MKRRDFIALAGATATAAVLPRVAFGQQAANVPRLALLSIPVLPERFDAFYSGLADYGYVDGKNIVVERFTAPTNSDLPVFAARAVASKPDIIVILGTPAAVAAKNATTTIPIVFPAVVDPTGVGLVTSLARPGGNLTGMSSGGPDLLGKQISVVKDIIPTVTRLAVLMVPSDPLAALYRPQVEAAAKVLKIEPLFVEIDVAQDFAPQFGRVIDTAAQAVFCPTFNYFAQSVRDTFFDLLVRNRLPALTSDVVPGAATPFSGVAAYGGTLNAIVRQSAVYVDAILKGAKPGDLPVQLPTVFDFAVNLDMAKKIGINISNSILVQATLVIDYDIRAPKAPK